MIQANRTPMTRVINVLTTVMIRVFYTVFHVTKSDKTSLYMAKLIPSSEEILNHTKRIIGSKNRKTISKKPINPYQFLNNEEKENENDLLVFLLGCRCCGIICPLPSLSN